LNRGTYIHIVLVTASAFRGPGRIGLDWTYRKRAASPRAAGPRLLSSLQLETKRRGEGRHLNLLACARLGRPAGTNSCACGCWGPRGKTVQGLRGTRSIVKQRSSKIPAPPQPIYRVNLQCPICKAPTRAASTSLSVTPPTRTPAPPQNDRAQRRSQTAEPLFSRTAAGKSALLLAELESKKQNKIK
jgi:hypothetical protein